MRRLSLHPIAVGLLGAFLAIFALAQTSQAAPLTDKANKHNMSSAATHGGPHAQPVATGGTDQICIFCHTPHSAAPDSALWSRPEPGTATFPLYGQLPAPNPEIPLAIKGNIPGKEDPTAPSRSKYTNTDPAVTYPNGASRMCLSCHDGATAVGILRDNTTIAMVGGLTTLSNPGVNTLNPVVDLSTSHPISFVFDNAVLADVLAARGINTYQLPSTADAVDTPLDGQSRMQCTTCHDPHDDTQLDKATLPPFWRQDSVVFVSEYDDVCNACHKAAPLASPPLHSLP